MNCFRPPFFFALSLLIILLEQVTAKHAFGATDDSSSGLYLALGDSISFGFIPNAGYEYVNPRNFIGFPDYASRASDLRLVNASCPGETTASFSSSTALDRGCRYYRSLVPLHVAYTSTQMDFAIDFLKAHPETKLVTIDLGANDVLLLEDQCANNFSCIVAGLPPVLAAVTTNLDSILSNLHATRFHGTVVVVNYYSTDYSDPNVTNIFSALNQAVSTAASQNGVRVAEVFTTFQNAVAAAGGNTCKAGLLKASPSNEFTCDIHPSQTGQQLIARAVLQLLATAQEATIR
jgi:lysophospholipase L1-like esterase